jgi:hypothetical protein
MYTLEQLKHLKESEDKVELGLKEMERLGEISNTDHALD